MQASKEWGECACNCGKTIKAGDQMTIVEGMMYLLGHEERKTRQMQALGGGESKKSKKEKK
jgi:hypothetical protein